MSHKPVTNHDTANAQPFATLQAPVETVAEVVVYFDPDLGEEITTSAELLPRVSVEEDAFLTSFFRKVRNEYGITLDTDTYGTDGLLEDALTAQCILVTDMSQRTSDLVVSSQRFVQRRDGNRLRRLWQAATAQGEMVTDYRFTNRVADPETRFHRNAHKLSDSLVGLIETPADEVAQRALVLRNSSLSAHVVKKSARLDTDQDVPTTGRALPSRQERLKSYGKTPGTSEELKTTTGGVSRG